MLNLSHLGHAGHRSAVIVVFSAIIDTSVLVDNLYRRIIKYSGGCCCCWLSRQRIHRICRIWRCFVVGAVQWSITLQVVEEGTQKETSQIIKKIQESVPGIKSSNETKGGLPSWENRLES